MRLSKEALKKYADGTTYKSGGKTYKRVSYAGTKRGDNYCSRSSGQKRTEKVLVRRKAWGCSGKKSITGLGAVSPYINASKNELSYYIMVLNNELQAAKKSKMKLAVKIIKKDLAEVRKILKDK